MHLRTRTSESWDPFLPDIDDASHREAANRAIGISAIGLGLAGLLELAVAILSGSVALLGDALHNLSDVSTSGAMYAGFRLSKRPATASHPYGYERAEDLAGLGVAVVIWASAVFALLVSIHKLTEHGRTSALSLGMAAAVVGVVGNQVVARYKRRVGRKINSVALLADAKHSWLDATASAGALLGLMGVAAGLRWADGVAGLLVTAFIVHVGWQVTSDVLVHLMDGVDPDVIARAEAAANGVDGIEHVHVRARWLGRSLVVEVEGFAPAGLTLESAEGMGRRVEGAVLAAVRECRAVRWSPRAMPEVDDARPFGTRSA